MDEIELWHEKMPTIDKIRLVRSALVPVALTGIIISLILFRVSALKEFAIETRQTRTTACSAVKVSNDDLDKFLHQVLTSKSGKDFGRQLAASHKVTYRRCVAALP
jgi:hypothetical protein